MSVPIELIADRLKNFKKIIILTGAGISKSSGVPAFRDVYRSDDKAIGHDFPTIANPS